MATTTPTSDLNGSRASSGGSDDFDREQDDQMKYQPGAGGGFDRT